MFETAELGRKIQKEDYERQITDFRTELLRAQFAMQKTDAPTLILIAGVEGSGKGEVVNELSQWLDPRGLLVHHFLRPSEEAAERPDYWKYWMRLPPRGRIGIYYGSWYTDPIVDRVERRTKRDRFELQLSRIRQFERMLAEDGALIFKLWLHLPKSEQKKRFQRLDSKKSTSWQITPRDWAYHDLYDRFLGVSETAIRETDTGHAPWHVIESTDRRYRNLTVGRHVLDGFRRRLEADNGSNGAPIGSGPSLRSGPIARSDGGGSVLSSVDLTQTANPETYAEEESELQNRLAKLAWKAWKRQRSTVIVFEGWDAAGKGGAIRRISESVDARLRQVISVAAPTDEERAHHYLWRFWRHVPRGGSFTIYDRSWYGRVLVERVEAFARENEWRRAYQEINDFEEQLAERGIVVLKFFLHISKDEQARRFEERKTITYKQHKITDEDYRNREKWPAYEVAIDDMIARTSTSHAPWTLIAGNDKRFARLEVLRTLGNRLEKAL